jgi:hypothetical protein
MFTSADGHGRVLGMRWFWQIWKKRRTYEPRYGEPDRSAWTEADRDEYLSNWVSVTPPPIRDDQRKEYAQWVRVKWEEKSLPVRTAKLVIDFPLEETPDIEVEGFITPHTSPGISSGDRTAST